MANDGSLFSIFEQWIADTIAEISPEFDDGDVKVYGGVSSFMDLEKVLKEIGGLRDPTALVYGDRIGFLETGAEWRRDRRYVCSVFIANKNPRGTDDEGEAARMGEGAATVGTHMLVEQCLLVLDNKRPNLASAGFRMVGVRVGDVTALTMEAGFSVQQMIVEGRGAKT